jgi:hypothetical protein
MKSTLKNLSMFMFLSFICSTTTYRSYADPVGDVTAVVEETKTEQPLKKAKTKTTKFYGNGSFASAWNQNVKDKDPFTLNADIKLGIEKAFVFEDDKIDSKVEIKATTEKIALEEFFFTYNCLTFGLTDSLFAESAIQATLKKECYDKLTVGVSIEKAQKLSFFATDDKMKKEAEEASLKPKNYVPAVSSMVQYSLPNELGDVTLGGLWRPLVWKNEKENKTNLGHGFGGKLSSEMPFKSKTRTVTFSGIVGKSIGEYIPGLQDAADSEAVSMRMTKDKTKVEPITASSVNVSYEHHWTTAIRSKATATGVKAFQPNKPEQADNYDLGLYGTFNTSYWFTEYTSVGLEYGINHRTNVDQKMKDGKLEQTIKAILSFKFGS